MRRSKQVSRTLATNSEVLTSDANRLQGEGVAAAHGHAVRTADSAGLLTGRPLLLLNHACAVQGVSFDWAYPRRPGTADARSSSSGTGRTTAGRMSPQRFLAPAWSVVPRFWSDLVSDHPRLPSLEAF